MYLRDGNWVTEFYHEGVRYKKSLGRGISKTVAKEREAKYRQEVSQGRKASNQGQADQVRGIFDQIFGTCQGQQKA